MLSHVKAEAALVAAVAVALIIADAAVVVPSCTANAKLNQRLTIVATSGNTTNTPITPIKIRHALRLLDSVNNHPDVHLANPGDSRSKSKIFHTSS
jgi:hypothetical protein